MKHENRAVTKKTPINAHIAIIGCQQILKGSDLQGADNGSKNLAVIIFACQKYTFACKKNLKLLLLFCSEIIAMRSPGMIFSRNAYKISKIWQNLC